MQPEWPLHTTSSPCARPRPPSPASVLARRPRRVLRPPELKPKTMSRGCSKRPPNLLRSRRRRRRPPWRRHAALRQLPGLRRRLLDGGAEGIRVLRSAARALRHRQGGPARSSYVLVNESSPKGGQRGRSCHGSLPRWSPNAALPPPELPHGQPGLQPLPPPTHTFPPPLFPPQTTAARDLALDLLSAPVSFTTGGSSPFPALNFPRFMAAPFELELGLIQTEMAK